MLAEGALLLERAARPDRHARTRCRRRRRGTGEGRQGALKAAATQLTDPEIAAGGPAGHGRRGRTVHRAPPRSRSGTC